jgi:hypothetical protein
MEDKGATKNCSLCLNTPSLAPSVVPSVVPSVAPLAGSVVPLAGFQRRCKSDNSTNPFEFVVADEEYRKQPVPRLFTMMPPTSQGELDRAEKFLVCNWCYGWIHLNDYMEYWEVVTNDVIAFKRQLYFHHPNCWERFWRIKDEILETGG